MPAKSPVLFCLDDARFDAHRDRGPHPEQPARLEAVRRGLLDTLLNAGAEQVAPREVADDELLRVHTPEHLALLERMFAQGQGHIDGDTFFGPGSRSAARLAAGAGAQLGERLMGEEAAVGVLTARPPGHHATRSRAMGFCLLNNVAVAAAAALARGAERVAILDWDVHHGNGTQAIFEDDPRVLFISLHQFPLYPGTGKSDDIGEGPGRGRTINLALPGGSQGKEYAAAFRKVVMPALEQFDADVLLVSAGFDAHRDDPLAGMGLTDGDFGAFTQSALQLTERLGKPRLGIVLEGGYDLAALERSSRAVGEALLGKSFALDEGPIGAHAERAIDATRRALDGHFEL
jgi:acetoin utilization deacetylase AcuC-like enzyme